MPGVYSVDRSVSDVCEKVTHQKVIKTYLPTYLRDSSDSSDSSYSSYGSDNSDNSEIFLVKFFK